MKTFLKIWIGGTILVFLFIVFAVHQGKKSTYESNGSEDLMWCTTHDTSYQAGDRCHKCKIGVRTRNGY
jgi:hypothetical protein